MSIELASPEAFADASEGVFKMNDEPYDMDGHYLSIAVSQAVPRQLGNLSEVSPRSLTELTRGVAREHPVLSRMPEPSERAVSRAIEIAYRLYAIDNNN